MDLPQAARACTPDALEIREAVQKPTSVHGLTLEAWSSGYLDGALIIMACVTIANMRKGVLLHKVSYWGTLGDASLTDVPAYSPGGT